MRGRPCSHQAIRYVVRSDGRSPDVPRERCKQHFAILGPLFGFAKLSIRVRLTGACSFFTISEGILPDHCMGDLCQRRSAAACHEEASFPIVPSRRTYPRSRRFHQEQSLFPAAGFLGSQDLRSLDGMYVLAVPRIRAYLCSASTTVIAERTC